VTEAAPAARPTGLGWLGLIAGLLVAAYGAVLIGDALAGVVCAFTVTAVLAGVFRPRLLVPLVAAACVVLPPYVGWLVPGAGFVNLQRGIMYGGALGVAVWALRERMEGRWLVPDAVLERGSLRLALLLLGAAWVVAPVIALALGPANAARALNATLYQALAFWVGLAFTRDLDGRRLLQLTFVALLVYTIPYWVYELEAGHGAFASYVPPLPDLLAGRAIFRGRMIRVAGTFGQPLAFDQFLLIAIPVVFSLRYARFPRVLSFGLALLGAVALVATRSRSPWAALVLAAVTVVVVRRRSLRASLVVAVIVLAAAAVPVTRAIRSGALARQARSLLETKYSRQSEAEFSAAGRVFVTLGALRAIRQRPLTGYGVNASGSSARLRSVDDYYLVLAVEQGAVVAGLTLLALLVGWLGVMRSGVGPEAAWIAFAAGAYLVQWVFVGLHDTAPLLFLVLGHLFASVTVSRRPVVAGDNAPAAMPESGG
jgi:hypothetical protein